MPKSKRARIVHTSTVQKKPSKAKSASLYAAVQAAAEQYQHVFVFRVENMRNTYLKEVRQHFSDSRMFFGKTKVMAKALGMSAEDECMPGLAGLEGGAGGEDDVPLPHSLEVLVRKWGMPTRLEKGRVVLDQEFVVCEEGKTLNSNQTALLKLFGVAMAEFKVQILAWWSAAEQEVTVHEQAGDIGDASDHEDAERMEEG